MLFFSFFLWTIFVRVSVRVSTHHLRCQFFFPEGGVGRCDVVRYQVVERAAGRNFFSFLSLLPVSSTCNLVVSSMAITFDIFLLFPILSFSLTPFPVSSCSSWRQCAPRLLIVFLHIFSFFYLSLFYDSKTNPTSKSQQNPNDKLSWCFKMKQLEYITRCSGLVHEFLPPPHPLDTHTHTYTHT